MGPPPDLPHSLSCGTGDLWFQATGRGIFGVGTDLRQGGVTGGDEREEGRAAENETWDLDLQDEGKDGNLSDKRLGNQSKKYNRRCVGTSSPWYNAEVKRFKAGLLFLVLHSFSLWKCILSHNLSPKPSTWLS